MAYFSLTVYTGDDDDTLNVCVVTMDGNVSLRKVGLAHPSHNGRLALSDLKRNHPPGNKDPTHISQQVLEQVEAGFPPEKRNVRFEFDDIGRQRILFASGHVRKIRNYSAKRPRAKRIAQITLDEMRATVYAVRVRIPPGNLQRFARYVNQSNFRLRQFERDRDAYAPASGSYVSNEGGRCRFQKRNDVFHEKLGFRARYQNRRRDEKIPPAERRCAQNVRQWFVLAAAAHVLTVFCDFPGTQNSLEIDVQIDPLAAKNVTQQTLRVQAGIFHAATREVLCCASQVIEQGSWGFKTHGVRVRPGIEARSLPGRW